MAATYHAGELEVQLRAGEAEIGQRLLRGIRSELPEVAQAFLAQQRLLLVASTDPEGRVWCSVLSGPAGFVRAADERTVAVAARPHDGEPLARALAAAPAPVGLLAIEPATRRRMRVNGTAEPVDGGLRVRTEQVYSNCPKYIARRAIAAEAVADGPAPQVERRQALGDADRRLIAHADTFFIATAAPDGSADASHRGGSPGFVAVHDARSLSFPDYAGNSMYMTLGNLAANPRAGFLFADWDSGDTLQLSGRASVDWSPERAASVPGAQRLVDFAVGRVIRTTAALPHRWALQERSRFNPPA
jgi:predicted pyridoxine 5'-phosphate oxidase superfamily flavin-nucleotide-binding protein